MKYKYRDILFLIILFSVYGFICNNYNFIKEIII